MLLAVPRQTDWVTESHCWKPPPESNPRDLWPLRHLIRVMRRHNLAKKKTMTKTNTFREHIQRAIPDTSDLWDIWSEWWEDITWPKKRQWQRQWQWQIHLESTLKERSQRLLTFETFDQSDEKTWPDQKISTYQHTYSPTYLPIYLPLRTPLRSDHRDLWHLRH